MKKYLWISIIAWMAMLISGCTGSSNNVVELDTAKNYSITDSWTMTVLNEEQKSKLQYLVQEEKLARDVYSEMLKIRWSKKFSNIINSEENHESQVARLLDVYGIVNPVQWLWQWEFVDSEFTDLYKQLVRSGSVSLASALQVGVDIETMDIKDIEEMMPLFANRADIQQVLNALLEWSKRHLAAFSK
jgi:hypothetical protein